MRWPWMLTSVAEVQIAGLQAEARNIGAALNEALKERDALQARLDALTPARDPVTKRFVGKAVSNG